MTRARSLRVPDDLDDKLVKKAEMDGASLSSVMLSILEKAFNDEYKFLDAACPALVHLNDGFYCAEKAPTHRKLGDGSGHDARLICEAHDTLKGVLSEIKKLRAQHEQGVTLHLPVCRKGGYMSDDMKKLYCPLNGGWMSITRCETLAPDDKPCQWFRFTNTVMEPIKR